MSEAASQITSVCIVCSTVGSGAYQSNIKAPRQWPLCEKITGDRWTPTKGHQRGKCFHLMTSSCKCSGFMVLHEENPSVTNRFRPQSVCNVGLGCFLFVRQKKLYRQRVAGHLTHHNIHAMSLHGLFSLTWFTLILAWISNHMPSKVWGGITNPFSNFNGCTVVVWEWLSNFTPHSIMALRWRHNELDGVSDHQSPGCLPNRLFGRTPKKTSKLRVTGLCAGNSPGTGEFPAQKASNAENVSIWWRHHGCNHVSMMG